MKRHIIATNDNKNKAFSPIDDPPNLRKYTHRNIYKLISRIYTKDHEIIIPKKIVIYNFKNYQQKIKLL